MSGWDEGSVFVSGGGGVGGTRALNDLQNRSSHEIKVKFLGFIRGWKNQNNVFIYRDQLIQNYNLANHFLEVNIDHLTQYDSDLTNYLLSKPNEIIPIFEDAIKEAIKSMNFDTESVEEIQVLFRSAATPSPIRSLKSNSIARLVKISGIVISASRTQPKPITMKIRCKNCDNELMIHIRPGISHSMMPQTCEKGENSDGKKCGNNPYVVLSDHSTFVNQQILKIQESPETIPTGEMPRHILLSLDRWLAEKVTPGTRVSVLGVYGIFEGPGGRRRDTKSASIRTPYLRVLGITSDASGGRDSFTYTPKEEEEFRKLARRPDLYRLISSNIAPAIYGHEDIKKAISCQMFGGSSKRLPDRMKLRGDINLLLLGDPGTAKSQLLKFVEKLAPISVYTSGKGSSAAGLTASVIREPSTGEFYLEGGAMVVADGGVVCIDEFDKMDINDRVAIHEAMEQQTISIAKAGITTILNSRTSVLAAANPVFGRYDDLKSAGENIDFQSTILSRFDLIFIVRDPKNEARDKKIADHVMKLHMRYNHHLLQQQNSSSSGSQVEELDVNFLKKYISFCRTRCSPRLSEDAEETLINHYVSVRSAVRQQAMDGQSQAIPITIRQLEAIVRISESLAKMQLSPVATNQHANEAIRLFTISTFDAITTNNAVGESLTPQLLTEIQNAENLLKKRVPVGSRFSEKRMVDELSTTGLSPYSIRKAIDILRSEINIGNEMNGNQQQQQQQQQPRSQYSQDQLQQFQQLQQQVQNQQSQQQPTQSQASYVFQKQLLPSTGIELCLKTNLISKDTINLVLGKANILQVYTIRYEKYEKIEVESQQEILNSILSSINDDDEDNKQETEDHLENNNNNNNNNHQKDNSNNKIKKIEYKPTLELNFEKILFGNIESLGSIRYPDAERDSIILTFKDAKISILDYNPDTMDLEISSMHYYEKEELKFGRKHFINPPILKVDSQQRCAVMILYDRNLVVLPFKQSSSILDDDEDEDMLGIGGGGGGDTSNGNGTGGDGEKKNKKNESYVIELKTLGIENVKDFCFLHGYYEPTLLFLHEPSQTWTSRISVKKLTSVLTAVSLNLSNGGGERTNPIIWRVENYPYNCKTLISVPEPLGGAIVLSPNIMFHVNQSTSYGLAVNEYANIDVAGDQFPFQINTSLNLVFELERSNFVFLENDKLLGSLKGGELLIFHLFSDGRSVSRIHVSKAGGSVLSSCMCVLSSNLIFLGSRLGDSLLLQYTEKSISEESAEHENFSNPYKKQKTSEVFDIFEDEDSQNNNNGSNNQDQEKKEDEIDEDDIFKEKKNQLKSYQLGICDNVSNIGPISDMIIGEAYDLSSELGEGISYRDKWLEILACSGNGKNGALSILQQSIRPDLITAFELPGVKQAWTVYDEYNATTTGGNTANKKRQHDQMDTSTNGSDQQQPEGQNYHSFLFLALVDRTLVFQIGDQLKEIDQLSISTMSLGNIFGRKRIVQVYSNGIKLLSGHNLIMQDIQTTKPIKSSCILDPFVLLLLEDGTISIKKGNSGVYQLMEFDFPKKDNIMACSLFIDNEETQFFSNSSSRSDFLDTNSKPSQNSKGFEFRIRSFGKGFKSIGNRKGVFICGSTPLWGFCEKGFLRLHPMDFEGPISIFTTFHNIEISNGFIYFSKTGVLRICQMPGSMNFEHRWPIRKVPMKMTCHKVAYHPESKCYLVVVSFPQVLTEIDPESKKPIATEEKFQIKLIDPIDWNNIIDSFSLQERETVLSMKVIQLKYTEADGVTRLKPYVCVGTAFTHGEDTQCKGRILILEVVTHKTQFEADSAGEKKLNLLFEKEQKGPVTAMASLNGLLVMTIGPKVIVNNFSSGSLVGLAFYDAQIYIVNISTVKNYVLIADMYKSIYFLKWKDGTQLLTLLSKDYSTLNIYSTEFLINEKQLSIMVSDSSKNILMFSFDPRDSNSREGQMMLCNAGFHLGSHIQKFVRTPLKSMASGGSTVKNMQMVLYGTLDGSVGAVTPLTEKNFQLLYHLQSKLFYIPQDAGLNAKGYRIQGLSEKPQSFIVPNFQKNILDGDLIHEFQNLNLDEKRVIADSINSTPDDIIMLLKDLSYSSRLF
eukprot:gene3714-4627_t